MGFATVFSTLAPMMIDTAAGFISDFNPILAAMVGIALAGFALLILRRFIG